MLFAALVLTSRAYVTATYAHHDGAVAGQIDDRGRDQAAIPAVQDQIDAVFEFFINLFRIGARQFFTGQKQR